jgi:hypothetical protein
MADEYVPNNVPDGQGNFLATAIIDVTGDENYMPNNTPAYNGKFLATPVFLVNGHKFVKLEDFEKYKKEIQDEINDKLTNVFTPVYGGFVGIGKDVIPDGTAPTVTGTNGDHFFTLAYNATAVGDLPAGWIIIAWEWTNSAWDFSSLHLPVKAENFHFVSIKNGDDIHEYYVILTGDTVDDIPRWELLGTVVSNNNNMFYATTTNIMSTATKVLDGLPANYTPAVGDILSVKFLSGHSSVTGLNLSINGVIYPAKFNALDIEITAGSYGINAVGTFVFDGTNFNMVGSNRRFDLNDTAYNLVQHAPTYIAGERIDKYKVCMLGLDGKVYPLTSANSTSAQKQVQTTPLDPFSPVFYWDETGSITAGIVMGGDYFKMNFAGNTTNVLAYGFNGNGNLYPYQDIYLVGTIDANGGYVLDNSTFTSWYTWTIPAEKNGKIYKRVGRRGNGNNITIGLLSGIDCYYWDNGIKLYTGQKIDGDEKLKLLSIPNVGLAGSGVVIANNGIFTVSPTVDNANNNYKVTVTNISSDTQNFMLFFSALTNNNSNNQEFKLMPINAMLDPGESNSIMDGQHLPLFKFQKCELVIVSNFNMMNVKYFNLGNGRFAVKNYVYSEI